MVGLEDKRLLGGQVADHLACVACQEGARFVGVFLPTRIRAGLDALRTHPALAVDDHRAGTQTAEHEPAAEHDHSAGVQSDDDDRSLLAYLIELVVALDSEALRPATTVAVDVRPEQW